MMAISTVIVIVLLLWGISIINTCILKEHVHKSDEKIKAMVEQIKKENAEIMREVMKSTSTSAEEQNLSQILKKYL